MWDTLIVTPFANVLLFIYLVIGQNFGLAIVLFTILIRAITHPLMVKQIKGSQAMQDMQKDKRWIEAQEKYKGDREKLAQEQMRLYKELGVNPFSSCLPTLIQFPIIIGLYQSLTATLATTPLELVKLSDRIYPFLANLGSIFPWVPDVFSILPLKSSFLWMDLGMPERLHFAFLNGLPLIGGGIPVLAIIVMITTYMQGKLMATPSTNPGDQSAQMTKMMNLYMPILMGWISLTLASGLAIYFIASNLIGIGQYALLGKVNWRALIPSFKAEPKVAVKAVEKPEPKPELKAPVKLAPKTTLKSTKPVKKTSLKSGGKSGKTLGTTRGKNGSGKNDIGDHRTNS
ncbi:MAG TPA: YidC/Oxa1 family membrane protein insertase [Anaerolineaceae bacterium]